MDASRILPSSAPEAVLIKAVLRAADHLGVRQSALADTLGVSGATVSRLASGVRTLDPASKPGELGLLFVRVFRSLDALFGGQEADARAWFDAHNHHLGGVPREMIATVTGLAHVAGYLDAMRGRG